MLLKFSRSCLTGSTEAEGEIGGGPISAMEGQSQETIDVGSVDRGFNRKRDYGMRLLTFGDPSDRRQSVNIGILTTYMESFSRRRSNADICGRR
ncbi:hypothetical protein Tco_1357726 [Tanacetum coccineum]